MKIYQKGFSRNQPRLNFLTMENTNNIQYTLASMGDLLEQINRCNERINLLASYKAPELEQSILNAQSMRKQFLEQLDELLAVYSLEVRLRGMAA